MKNTKQSKYIDIQLHLFNDSFTHEPGSHPIASENLVGQLEQFYRQVVFCHPTNNVRELEILTLDSFFVDP